VRIAISTITTPAQPMGIGRYLVCLLESLQEIDHSNEYLIYTAQDNHSLFRLHQPNFREIRTPFSHNPRWLMRPGYFAWQNTWLQCELHARRVDVLHLPNLLPVLISGIPTVVTIPDLGEYRVEHKYGVLRQWYRKSILPITVRNASRIIAISSCTKNDLVSLIDVPESKVDVVHLGTSALPSVTASEEAAVLAKHVTGPYLLYVGAMFRHKNLERLITAYKRFRESTGLTHELLIVGKISKEHAELSGLVTTLGLDGCVRFTGYLTDAEVGCLYRHASAFVYVPLNEGFGLPVLEAMACETPVVTSNTSSLPEVAGDAALLVDPLSINEISAGIHRVLSDAALRSRLVTAGIERADAFSWRRCAELTMETYERALRN